MTQGSLTGNLAIVTGGSSGIGFALANELASRGCNLVICAEKEAELQKAAEKLRAGRSVNVQIVAADLTTAEGVEKLYDTAEAIGPVGILCANAGVGAYGDFVMTDAKGSNQETSLEAEFRMIDLNIKSVVHLTKLVSKDMVLRKQGKILITASVDSVMPDAFEVVYAGTKAFDYMFAESLREFLKDKGVTVTALMPGATNTNFFKRSNGLQAKVVQDNMLGNPADVAKAAIDALENGDDHVVAGFMNKVMATFAGFAPPKLVSLINRQEIEPKKKKQAA